MVKFVGGPSVSAQKSYFNHRIARPGQFRVPRAYGSIKKETKIVVRNYNYCGSSYGCGWQLPSWLQWAQVGVNFLQGLIPQPKVPTQPTVNPLQDDLDDYKKKIEDLEAEIEELKKKDPETPVEPKKPTETPDSSEISFKKEVTPGQEAKAGEITTIPAMVKFGKKLPDGRVQFQGWQTLADAYGVPNTEEFRNWFRINHLKDLKTAIWEPGKIQNFPKEINYPEGSDKKYAFDPDKFANAHDYHRPDGQNHNIKVGDLTEQRGPGTPATEGKTTYSSTVTATVDGKIYRSTASIDNAENETTAKNKLKQQMIQDLVSKGLKEEQARNAVANAKIQEN